MSGRGWRAAEVRWRPRGHDQGDIGAGRPHSDHGIGDMPKDGRDKPQTDDEPQTSERHCFFPPSHNIRTRPLSDLGKVQTSFRPPNQTSFWCLLVFDIFLRCEHFCSARDYRIRKVNQPITFLLLSFLSFLFFSLQVGVTQRWDKPCQNPWRRNTPAAAEISGRNTPFPRCRDGEFVSTFTKYFSKYKRQNFMIHFFFFFSFWKTIYFWNPGRLKHPWNTPETPYLLGF